MRRFTKFLKDMFTATDLERLPATASEMTLHDALRICAGRVRNDDRPARTRTALRQIGVCRYHSESDLHDQWHRLDHALRQTANLTVILVLGDFLRGNLREVIRRRRLAHRLVIVPHAGHWPGIDSFGDLALSAGSLGWNSIELCRDLRDEPDTSATASCQDEQLILVLPPSTSVRDVM
jgi:hypothetical protein